MNINCYYSKDSKELKLQLKNCDDNDVRHFLENLCIRLYYVKDIYLQSVGEQLAKMIQDGVV